MTIYRAWPDMGTLLADLMTREWTTILDAVPAPADDQPTPERIAQGIVAAIDALRANPLFRRILALDPDLILPYLMDRRGRSQQAIIDLLRPQIQAGQAAEHVRAGDPELLARTIVLASHGLALSAHTMADDTVTESDLATAFTDLVTKGLTP